MEEEDGYRSSEDEDYVPQDEESKAQKQKKSSKKQTESGTFVSRRQAARASGGGHDAASGKDTAAPEKTSDDLDDLFLRELGEHPSTSRKTSAQPASTAATAPSKSTTSSSNVAVGSAGGFSLASLQRPAATKKKGVVPFRLPPESSGPPKAKQAKTTKASADSSSKTVTITKQVDFAGETISVKHEVKAGSVAQRVHNAQEASKGAALDSIMGLIDKKQSISTLTKSKMDWEQFKGQNPAAAEVEKKSSYLDDVEFLERVDHRQHEQELDAKTKRR
ncbi:hypothetical protein PTSG_12066 [Salpingoeca rosetta]|uniref:BCNT-C domain-containing protein n=1 Tax=Salpingoeca rosetta (strain ATCC 50818 / BSB-021) TaxID=946362 RepID=F2U6E8_SALR5|nr:uncharacterized protein PTSG_12066 [Salpingoeca rosetta]EGD83089.1 hypothetical protein PTSG_12066 [Salpingoeca rosetta]|eukprot:XP_004995453.1 hypothetical protein PTSG_12066 [Salpingoeca rosetta]